ncbi:MAG: DNA polymerase III subunit delta [Candidatus Gastranaerophilaceae bacterium]
MAIWFFYGKEEFRISKEVEHLKNELVDPAFKTMNFRIFYSPLPEELIEICNTAPLMFGNAVSLVHCENYFFKTKNKKTEFSDEQISSLDYALKNVSELNTIIFVCNIPREDDKKIDSRTKLYKIIANHSRVKEFPQFRDYDKDFISFISSLLKEKDLIADSKTINHLTERLGVNLRLIDSELEKLKTAIFPKNKITNEDIDIYCSLTEDVFALADLIVGKDKNAVMKQLSAVLEKRHPLEVTALLHTNLHKLLYLKTYEKEKSTKAISDALKMPEYPVKLLYEKIKDVSFEKLIMLKHNLTDAEFKMKTGKTQNPAYLLEGVLLGDFENV